MSDSEPASISPGPFTGGLHGTSIIGGSRSSSRGSKFRAINPAIGNEVLPDYCSASLPDVERAASLAAAAVPLMERLSGRQRGAFLRIIASNIEDLGQDLFSRVERETGLPPARVKAEAGRTCAQLRLFADLVTEGSWVDARIDRADHNRKPRKPDVRSMLRPLGPVAVFGASNFPLAFSVAGGDTASAFAAGNPVIVKAHAAHPGTSEMVGQAITEAARACSLPDGTFSLLFDSGFEIGCALVTRPEVKAVGFTGSRNGGRSLMRVMSTRGEPIPFFAEMSSVNPIFFLPTAFDEELEGRLQGLLASLTNGSGQFCTKPGLVFVPAGHASEFASRLQELLEAQSVFTMLTADIARAYANQAASLNGRPGVTPMLSAVNQTGAQVRSALYRTTVSELLADPTLAEEMFGPACLLVQYSTTADLIEVACQLEGQLTATVHGTLWDLADHQVLLSMLERKAGRLILNSYPTGVEVNHAMVHGGPWPATSDARSSSVGTRAITRFARPVCYQDFPQSSLLDELKDANPLNIWRTVEGNRTRDNLI